MRAEPRRPVAVPGGSSVCGRHRLRQVDPRRGEAAARLGRPLRRGRRHRMAPGLGQRPGGRPAPRGDATILAAEDGWVFDTAWSSWRDLVLPHDRPGRWGWTTCAASRWRRLARRTVRRIIGTTPRSATANVETWRHSLQPRTRSSPWHFRGLRREARRSCVAWEADPATPPVLRLRRPGAGHGRGWPRRAPERTPGVGRSVGWRHARRPVARRPDLPTHASATR